MFRRHSNRPAGQDELREVVEILRPVSPSNVMTASQPLGRSGVSRLR